MVDFDAAIENDGAQWLHIHILCWGLNSWSLSEIFNYFSKCSRHRKVNDHINPSWEFGYINPPHVHKISEQTNDLKCLLNEISKTKVLSLESNITSLLNSITKPESKKGGSPSLNLHSIKPVNDTNVSATCVGASVTGIISTIVKIDLLEEAEKKIPKALVQKYQRNLKTL